MKYQWVIGLTVIVIILLIVYVKKDKIRFWYYSRKADIFLQGDSFVMEDLFYFFADSGNFLKSLSRIDNDRFYYNKIEPLLKKFSERHEKAVKICSEMFHNAESRYRQTAAWIAMDMEGAEPSFINEVLKLALGDPDGRVRTLAVQSIYELNYNEFQTHFGEFHRDKDPHVRWMALAYLSGQNGKPGPACIPILIDALSDPDEWVRSAVIKRLKKITGQDFGFEPAGLAEERERTINLWRQWWELEGKIFENPKWWSK